MCKFVFETQMQVLEHIIYSAVFFFFIWFAKLRSLAVK